MTKEFLKYGEEVQELAEKQLKETHDVIHEYYNQKVIEAEAKIDAMSDEEILDWSAARFYATHPNGTPNPDEILARDYPDLYGTDEDENKE